MTFVNAIYQQNNPKSHIWGKKQTHKQPNPVLCLILQSFLSHFSPLSWQKQTDNLISSLFIPKNFWEQKIYNWYIWTFRNWYNILTLLLKIHCILWNNEPWRVSGSSGPIVFYLWNWLWRGSLWTLQVVGEIQKCQKRMEQICVRTVFFIFTETKIVIPGWIESILHKIIWKSHC